jgi:hypothetical protein
MATTKNPENEKKFVIPLIAAGAAAIIIFHLVYWTEFKILTADPLFIILDIVGIAAYLLCSWLAWKHREGGAENTTRWVSLLFAIAVCVWVGAWCSQYRADKADGIEYEYKKK